VSIISQALIFVTRSRSWSFIERPGLLLFAFFVAHLSKRNRLGLGRCDLALQHRHIRPIRRFQIYHLLRLEWKGMGQYARKNDCFHLQKGLDGARGKLNGPLTNNKQRGELRLLGKSRLLTCHSSIHVESVVNLQNKQRGELRLLGKSRLLTCHSSIHVESVVNLQNKQRGELRLLVVKLKGLDTTWFKSSRRYIFWKEKMIRVRRA
ncbi:hypothetical protein Tco_0081019, partial [Tanacetum coccineum]